MRKEQAKLGSYSQVAYLIVALLDGKKTYFENDSCNINNTRFNYNVDSDDARM